MPSGYDSEYDESASTVTVAAATPGPDATVNVPLLQNATFTGTVFEDLNNDGTDDSGDPGIESATVTLLDSSGATYSSTTTGSDGTFTFGNLIPGPYTAVFTAPSGFVMNGSSDTWSEPVSIGSGQTVSVSPVPGYSATADAPITGTVFVDSDGSNYPDGTNAGVSGLTVTLLQGTATVATTTTDSSGGYGFSVAPGTYTVQVGEPTGFLLENSTTSTFTATVDAPGQATTVDEGVYTAALLSGTVTAGSSGLAGTTVTLYDANADVVATATTDYSGDFSFTGVQPGTYFVVYQAPTGYVMDGGSGITSTAVTVGSGQSLTGVSAAAYSATGTYSLGGTVFIDTTGGGTYSSGDSGLSGVTVALLDQYGNPALDSSGDPITTTTDSSGNYTFSGLTPGSYQVAFAAPSGSTYLFDDTGTTTDTGYANAPGPNSTLNVGVYQLATITGTVYADGDGSGTDDGSSSGMSGVAVTVLDPFGNTVATTSTDSSGTYSVTLPPGVYTIRLGLASGYALEGSSGDTLPPLTLTSGQTVDAGLNGPPSGGDGGSGPGGLGGVGGVGTESLVLASVGGFAWSDTMGTGLRDLSEAAVSGLEVELLDSSGDVVATTTTSASGYYQFSLLNAGTYSVQFILPSGDTGAGFSTQGASSDGTVASSANSSGLTNTITLSTGQQWLDENVGLTGIPV